jgi:twitching motility protein PilT
VSLASVLRGVIYQRLVPRAGGGRMPALEIMVSNGRIADRIIDPNKTSEILDIIVHGDY